MELYYSGDKIGYGALAKQFSLSKGAVVKILKKYKPVQGNRDITILVLPQNGYEPERPEEN